MSRIVIFGRIARAEYDDAIDWYEAKGAGLGRELEKEVDAVVGQIREFPEKFRHFRPRVRVARVRRFPYSIYFAEAGNVIGVLAVFHAKRNPRVLLRRLRGEG